MGRISGVEARKSSPQWKSPIMEMLEKSAMLFQDGMRDYTVAMH